MARAWDPDGEIYFFPRSRASPKCRSVRPVPEPRPKIVVRRKPRREKQLTADSSGFRGKLRYLVWPSLATLPFLETLLFNAHVDSGRKVLAADDYMTAALLFVSLWLLMCFAFLAEKEDVERLREEAYEGLRSWWAEKKSPKSVFLLVVVLIFVYAFGGRRELRDFVKDVILDRKEWSLLVLLILVSGAFWLLSWLIQSLGKAKPGLLRATISWSLGFRLSIFFYLGLLITTWRLVRFTGVNDVARVSLESSLIKDYLVLLIIANGLYGGLFKLVRCGALKEVFQNSAGMVHFFIVCGVIAIVAVGADYEGLGRAFTADTFPEPWQRKYLLVHILVRDIILLLLPIGALLYNTMLQFAREPDRHK